jgi:hypothetical protein
MLGGKVTLAAAVEVAPPVISVEVAEKEAF